MLYPTKFFLQRHFRLEVQWRQTICLQRHQAEDTVEADHLSTTTLQVRGTVEADCLSPTTLQAGDKVEADHLSPTTLQTGGTVEADHLSPTTPGWIHSGGRSFNDLPPLWLETNVVSNELFLQRHFRLEVQWRQII